MTIHASGRQTFWAALVAAALCVPSAAYAQSDPPPEFDALAAVTLMNEVPEAIRASCVPAAPMAEGAVATAQCQLGDQVLLYLRFADLASLESNYDLVMGMSGLAKDTGTSCADGAFEGVYTTDGAPAGRLVCQVGTEVSTIAAWSDVERLALGVVEKPGADDWAGLHAAWQAAQLVDATPALGPVASEAPVSSAPASNAPVASMPAAAGSTAPSPASSGAVAGESLYQWASEATASSQYGSTAWSAQQATGPADTTVYGDQQTAWAPSASDAGMEWLELTYDVAVIPSEVVIFETSANGFVTQVELWDPSTEAWVTAWEGQDTSPEFVIGFSPDLTPADFATDRVRVHIDTAVPGWNEVDAVALVGIVPEQP
jgi:hypothetical protein